MFLQAGCPSCRPTNSVKALNAVIHSITWQIMQMGHDNTTSACIYILVVAYLKYFNVLTQLVLFGLVSLSLHKWHSLDDYPVTVNIHRVCVTCDGRRDRQTHDNCIYRASIASPAKNRAAQPPGIHHSLSSTEGREWWQWPVILTIIWYSITHSLFHSRLKTFLFCKSFPPQPFLLPRDAMHPWY